VSSAFPLGKIPKVSAMVISHYQWSSKPTFENFYLCRASIGVMYTCCIVFYSFEWMGVSFRNLLRRKLPGNILTACENVCILDGRSKIW